MIKVLDVSRRNADPFIMGWGNYCRSEETDEGLYNLIFDSEGTGLSYHGDQIAIWNKTINYYMTLNTTDFSEVRIL